MRFDLTAEQEFFQQTTARFLDDHVPVANLRARRNDPAGFDPSFWRRGAELGWTSLLVPEARGGGSLSGAGIVDLTLVAYEFGRHVAPGPLASASAAAAALGDAGGDAHDAVLADVLAGARVVSWCSAEPPPHDALGEVSLEVRADGDDVVVSGVKRPVEAAAQSTHLLVTGRTAGARTQVLVPTD